MQYFFVGGCHKGGTNWVAAMLSEHPEVEVDGEAWLLGHGGITVERWLDREIIERWAKEARVEPTFLKGISLEEFERRLQRGLIESVLGLLVKEGTKAVGDRTPLFYNVAADKLKELFPEAVFVNCIRDGRDVVVSHAFMMLRQQDWQAMKDPADGERLRRFHILGEGDPQPLFTPELLEYLVDNWRKSVGSSAHVRSLFGDRYIQYRYEDLLEDPYAVGETFRLLGVKSDKKTVSRCVEAQRFEKIAKRKSGEADPTSFFRSGTSGEWEQYFRDEDRKLFKRLAGDLLIEFGYAENDSW